MIPDCFICGSSWLCSHREYSLVPHWRRIIADEAQDAREQSEALRRMPPSREASRAPYKFLVNQLTKRKAER